MLTQLGRFVTRKPWLVIAPVVAVTILLASALPSLEFRTNFTDFAPNTPLTNANTRIQQYFGSAQHLLFLHIRTTKNASVLTPEALRDQYRLEHTLSTPSFVNGTVGIADLVDAACQLEFNKTLGNCTDDEITAVLHDIFTPPQGNTSLITTTNAQTDTHTILGRGQNTDALNIKTVTLSHTNTTLTLTIQVNDLTSLPTSLQPPVPRASLVEWYLAFANHFASAGIDLHYQLAARLQPKYPLWIIGNHVPSNLHLLRTTRGMHQAYIAAAYLWITPPGQTIAFPIRLKTGTVTFSRSTGNVTITVSRQELSEYGIAPSFGSFKLPARLTNFTAGTRTYTPRLFKPLGGRIAFNTTTLLTTLKTVQQRRLLGPLFTRLLGRLGIPQDELQNMTSANTTLSLPATFSLADIESRWTQVNQAPDTGVIPLVYPLLPSLFSDFRTNILTFLPSGTVNATDAQSTIALVFLHPTTSTTEIDQMNQEITGLVQNNSDLFPSLSVAVTGPDIVSTEVNKVALDANTIIAPLIFIIIVIILFLAFRRPSYVVLPVIVFLLSTIWLFGTMALLHIPFNIIAVAILPLNIGLGVEYSVNLLYNYRIEREKGNSAATAVFLSIKEVGIAIFLAWATTFVAFISFLSATIPPIRNFGLFLAMGITYTFIISMTFLMSARYFIDRAKPYRSRKSSGLSIQVQLRKVAGFLLRHDKAVFAVALAISLVMLGGVTQLKTGFSLSQFIPQQNKSLQELNAITAEFPFASQDQADILIEGHVATVAALRGIAETQQRLQDDHYVARTPDGSAKTTSIYSILQRALADNESLASVFHVDPITSLPRDDADVAGFYSYLYNSSTYGMDTSSILYRRNGTDSATIIRVYVSLPQSKDTLAEYKVLQTDLNSDLTSYGSATAIVTGSDLITYSIMVSLTESQMLSTGICFVLAAIMLVLIYRRPTLGLVAMIPVSLSMVWVLGTIYYIGYTLNVLTVTVTSITIGVGIDYAVYITERFRLVADRTGDIDEAVIEAISRTGSGVSIAAISSIFGFGILLFAPIPPQQQFGLITAVTLLYAIATSIFILPLILARWARWRRKRVGYIISKGPTKESENI